jgi:Family of unknown function (DUF6142)
MSEAPPGCPPPPEFNTVPLALPTRQSGLGIASFVLGLVSAAAIFVAVAIAGLLVASGHGATDSDQAMYGVVGLCMLFFLLLALAGAVLGVLGVLQKKYRKLFAVIGLSINLLTIVGTAMLVFIGGSIR